MYSIWYMIHSILDTVHSIQYTVNRTKYTVHSIQRMAWHTVHITQDRLPNVAGFLHVADLGVLADSRLDSGRNPYPNL